MLCSPSRLHRGVCRGSVRARYGQSEVDAIVAQAAGRGDDPEKAKHQAVQPRLAQELCTAPSDAEI